jgi:hypothetical protein
MKQGQTRDHREKNNIIVFPGADLQESDYRVIRKINDKDLSIPTIIAGAACMAVLALFAFYGFISFLSNI